MIAELEKVKNIWPQVKDVLSEILHKKRKLNLRQIKLLSKRFNVSPAAFIE